MASSGYQSTTYGNFSEVNLNDPAEVYIDQILNKGMCSHQKRQKGYGDTLRNRRDKHLLTKQPEEREMEASIKTRFSQVNKQTKQMQQELHSIQNHLYKVKKSQPGKPENMQSQSLQEIDDLLIQGDNSVTDEEEEKDKILKPEEIESDSIDLIPIEILEKN